MYDLACCDDGRVRKNTDNIIHACGESWLILYMIDWHHLGIDNKANISEIQSHSMQYA